MLLLPSFSNAGWFDEGISNLGKALADVVTLGEEGRRRDRERAEQERLQAEVAQVAAEEQRQLVIKAKQREIELLNVSKSFLSDINVTLSFQIASIKNHLTTLNNFEISPDQWEKVANSNSKAYADAIKQLALNQKNELEFWIHELEFRVEKNLSSSVQLADFLTQLRNILEAHYLSYKDIPSPVSDENLSKQNMADLKNILNGQTELFEGFTGIEAKVLSEIANLQNQINNIENEIKNLKGSVNDNNTKKNASPKSNHYDDGGNYICSKPFDCVQP